MSPLAQTLAASPELFPAVLDVRSSAVTLWRLSRADYEQAAFLDGRIASGKPSRQLRFAELTAAVEETKLGENCDFIFHLGHVGSTLLSRLLGRHPALFSLREPDILRTLATIREKTRRDAYLPSFLKLWSRTYEPAARALVKTTSFVSEIAVELLSRPYWPRALAIGVAPEIYLATIFGGANAPAEARALAPFRLERARRRLAVEWRLDDFTEGEIVAMSWMCETLCLAEAVAAANARVLVLDFEEFLEHSHDVLAAAFAHFDVQATASDVAEILRGPGMRVYSKAPEYRYDAQTRHAVLAEGRTRYADQIRAGLSWIDRAAAEHPRLAQALTLFG